MTRAELRELVQALGYGADTEDAQNTFINSAYRGVLAARRWNFLQRRATLTLAAGASVVDLTQIADLRDVDAVRIDGRCGPDAVPLQDLRSLASAANTGLPIYWAQAASTVEFWPPADQNYDVVVDYICNPPMLVDDADVPVLPDVHHDVIAYRVCADIARRERDVSSQQLALSDYAAALQALRVADGLGQRQTSTTVRRSGIYSSNGPYGDGLYLS